MRSELVGRETLDDAFVERWSELAAAAAEPNVFVDPDFLLPALVHLDPEHEVHLLTVTNDEDRLVFLLPVMHVRRWKHLPITALVGWKHDYSYLGTPLVAADAVATACDALIGCVQRRELGADLVVLSWTAIDGPVADALAAQMGRAAPLVLDAFTRPVLRREVGGDTETRLGKGTRRRLAERWRQLERELGEMQVVDRAGDPAAHERFLTLEASGWKGEEGSAMASDSAHASFFTETAARFAEHGRLEVHSLETADGTVLAMSVRLRAGTVTFSFKVAHDERYRKYAPGRQLELLLLKALEEGDDLEWVDSCAAPGNEFLEALFTERRMVGNMLVTGTNGWRANMVATLPALRRWR